MYTNTKAVPVKLQYKIEGKSYGSNADVGEIPFDEVIVPVGESVDLGPKARVFGEVELSGSAPSADDSMYKG